MTTTKNATRYMSAADAYRATDGTVALHAGWLSNLSITQLIKLRDELDAIADYFERNPSRWTFGDYRREDQVCSVGLLRGNDRRAAGIKDFVRPRTVDRLVGRDFIITLNDERVAVRTYEQYVGADPLFRRMGPRNIVRVYRLIAEVLDDLILHRQLINEKMTSDHVLNKFSKRLEAAARKAEYNKLHPKHSKVSAKATAKVK